MKAITFYKCYWPEVWQYVKSANYKSSEAFGAVMTLEVGAIFADGINNFLPVGAVVDMTSL